jgi:signal transduction histidine kinase
MPEPTRWKLELRPRRFAPRLERAFQEDYYNVSRRGLLITSAFLIVLFLLLTYREIVFLHRSALNVATYIGPMLCLCACVAAVTMRRATVRNWQAILTAAAWLAISCSLLALASDLRTGPATGVASVFGLNSLFSVYFFMFMVAAALFRFQFIWAAILNVAVFLSGLFCVSIRLPADSVAVVSFAEMSLLVVFTLVLSAYFQESLARRAFLAHHLLQWERNDEVRRRERTEGMLNVLGRAIAVIVHDLGGPLTSVQAGAQAMKLFIDDPDGDGKTLAGFAELIENNAQMLNHLRLSLIEQTRVIEGKPTPLDLQPVSLRAVIEASSQFQKPGTVSGREIDLDCTGDAITVDSMKMTTVFMNIIGNALKYSDGVVRVSSRCDGDHVTVAVLDQGDRGIGITQKQAKQLFVAFGRLEIHSHIQGTGLGLVSVQKIVEAHGGEVFIEGHLDGTLQSGHFSTARAPHAPVLTPPFRTAFVVRLPQSPDVPTTVEGR